MTGAKTPTGWASVRLDDIAEVRLGRQRSPKNHTGTQMRPYLRAANLTWDGIVVSDVKEMNFTDDEVVTYRLADGDILLSEASGSAKEVGKPGIWRGQMDGDVCFQNTLIRVRPEQGVDVDYLYFRLLHEALRGGFVESSRGVGIHHLGSSKLSALSLALPPAAEQRRIAETLGTQVPNFARASHSLRRLLRMTSTLRHRVLMDAVQGMGEGPENWTITTLDEVAETLSNGMFVSRPGVEPAGAPILRIGAVRSMALDVTDRRWTGLPLDDPQVERYRLRESDLLFTRYNGNPEYVGACAVVPHLAEALVYPDKLIRVRLDSGKAYAPFVAMACSVGACRAFIRSKVRTTAGQAGVSGKDLRSVPLTLPSPAEQRRIWANTKPTLDQLDLLEQAVRLLLVRVDSGRRSTIRRGVLGQLAPQEPRDEPATTVLSRIAERRSVVVARKAAPRKVRALRASKTQENPK